ncbi:hypothetical protein ANN_03251 [Periplaneta americana]|uniref:Reverse transcriptase domain-containing protein n=1 Tax=Periplaneta americana TaxID=6978 RepID=A0ABQ8TYG7_PERAM|nr:hypothetical protein ANN_03251 [Periplaneta americana]
MVGLCEGGNEPSGSLKAIFQDIQRALNGMKADSAAGPDRVLIQTLKLIDCDSVINKILEIMMDWNVVPDGMRDARTILIYKGKGERCYPSNWRSISICSVVRRLIERVIDVKMRQFALLNENQRGFVSQPEQLRRDILFLLKYKKAQESIFVEIPTDERLSLPCMLSLNMNDAFRTEGYRRVCMGLNERLGITKKGGNERGANRPYFGCCIPHKNRHKQLCRATSAIHARAQQCVEAGGVKNVLSSSANCEPLIEPPLTSFMSQMCTLARATEETNKEHKAAALKKISDQLVVDDNPIEMYDWEIGVKIASNNSLWGDIFYDTLDSLIEYKLHVPTLGCNEEHAMEIVPKLIFHYLKCHFFFRAKEIQKELQASTMAKSSLELSKVASI